MCLIIMVKYMTLGWVLYHPRYNYDEVISDKIGKGLFDFKVSCFLLSFYLMSPTFLYVINPRNIAYRGWPTTGRRIWGIALWDTMTRKLLHVEVMVDPLERRKKPLRSKPGSGIYAQQRKFYP
jgi:hypothetical protein